MKAIIIYENDLGAINAAKLKHASFCCEFTADDITDTLKGTPVICKSANCSKEDTYDFETGALIALMKMCGREKVTKACDELYKDDDYKNALQEMTENNEKLIKENNYLKYIKSCRESAIKSLEHTRDLLIIKNNELIEENKEVKESDKYAKSEVGRLSFEKHRLEEENEKLKLDCEKLKHGYLDTDMIFCGGRQNGKQYTFLVDLFKKIDQKKVDAAYKEAYNTTLPVWQKEVLKQMYDIHHVNEWLYKIPTKREEMWDKIFALHKENDVIIKVKREDVNTFLHEIENKIPEITWASGVKIFETKYTIKDIYKELKTCDEIYFRLSKETKLTYSCDPHIHPYRNHEHISYLPPMRWDLFKKGRIYVKLDAKHFDAFKQACIRELGISPNTGYFNGEMIVINIPKEERFVTTRDLKGFKARKIINWEDVRDKTTSMEDPYDTWSL